MTLSENLHDIFHKSTCHILGCFTYPNFRKQFLMTDAFLSNKLTI